MEQMNVTSFRKEKQRRTQFGIPNCFKSAREIKKEIIGRSQGRFKTVLFLYE